MHLTAWLSKWIELPEPMIKGWRPSPFCWELTPSVSAQWKEQVPFKNFHAKRIYFSFELQTINTKTKLTSISNIPLWSIRSSRELFTEKKPGIATTSKWFYLIVIMNSSCTVLRISTPMAAGWPLYARVGRSPSRKNPRKLDGTWERFGAPKTAELWKLICFYTLPRYL